MIPPNELNATEPNDTRTFVVDLATQFVRQADDVELEFLHNMLAFWAKEYPRADHEYELTIATAASAAERKYCAEHFQAAMWGVE